ncbi:DUF393 domain-containing protein [Pontibacillus salipaludis]|uniref:thiol-disulfide oxidoreductase DCC family protein n=1 Tax=Pontibacillus salipaludis TaxID=1697394 RepID=UPI0031F0AD16
MRHLVFYDAQCPFCYHVKLVLRQLDWFKKVDWVSVQEVDEHPDQYPYLQYRDIYDEIHMLTSSGNLKEGYYAIRRLLAALPLTVPISLLLYIPFADRLGSPLYKWFSRHRYQWFGQYDEPRYA